MVGCIKGADTLVSTSFFSLLGFNSELNSFAEFSESSTRVGSSHFDPSALADQEYYTRYSDTSVVVDLLPVTLDEIERRLHRPIGIEISQTSRAWSDGGSNRFVIFDLWIRNISAEVLYGTSVGINISPVVGSYDNLVSQKLGTMIGLIEEAPLSSDSSEGFNDTLMIAWSAHSSGAPEPGFSVHSPTGVMGCRILRAPAERMSFNWWGGYSEVRGFGGTWGPSLRANAQSYGASQGWPLGDRARYQLMTNGEIDYDQMYAAKNFPSSGWRPPPTDVALARSFASGTEFPVIHLTAGPYPRLAPGDSLPFTYALFIGEKFHTRPDNFSRNFDPDDPKLYRDNLDFSSLIQAGRAADWYFDNPGVDTDGDGYFGKFYLQDCRGGPGAGCDTVWYKGDGVPDWGGPKAPASPNLDLTSQPNRVILRWAGSASETAKDQLSRQRDFEGYKVYSSRTNTIGEYALIASWDIPDNFYRIAYNSQSGTWRQVSYPATIEAWKRVIGDPEFDPRDYAHPSLSNGYKDIEVDTVRDASGAIVRIVSRDRTSYWAMQGPNHGNTYLDGGVEYQNRIQRIDIRDTVIGEDTLQYGIYEMIIENLNAAIPLWFSVTAFDHGDYKRGVVPLEGGTSANAQFAFPVYSADVVADSGLGVTVYPNPYKISYPDVHGNLTSYYNEGYEAYGLPQMREQERRIWFANLPDTANIAIYSLDGDLIREIHHPDKHLTRYSSIVGWDLISRNTQAVTSGIYIWKVDSRLGSQVGKIVIIK